MTERVLDFSARPVLLRSRNSLLQIESEGALVEAIPFAEIAVMLASQREVTFTQSVLSNLAEAGGIFVTCNEKQMPAAMLLPLREHYQQAERFVRQAALPAPRKKRLWQAVVRAKVRAQAEILREAHGTDCGLGALAARVVSGDKGNLEAIAARRYWTALFAGSFVRSDDRDTRNALLNYGYAVLRAATARAICAAGLHPSFGLHHANKLNPFLLADDLMEPFRPVIDRTVWRLSREESDVPLHQESKRALIAAVTARYVVEGENRTLFDFLLRLAQSLAAVVGGLGTALVLPAWAPER